MVTTLRWTDENIKSLESSLDDKLGRTESSQRGIGCFCSIEFTIPALPFTFLDQLTLYVAPGIVSNSEVEFKVTMTFRRHTTYIKVLSKQCLEKLKSILDIYERNTNRNHHLMVVSYIRDVSNVGRPVITFTINDTYDIEIKTDDISVPDEVIFNVKYDLYNEKEIIENLVGQLKYFAEKVLQDVAKATSNENMLFEVCNEVKERLN